MIKKQKKDKKRKSTVIAFAEFASRHIGLGLLEAATTIKA